MHEVAFRLFVFGQILIGICCAYNVQKDEVSWVNKLLYSIGAFMWGFVVAAIGAAIVIAVISAISFVFLDRIPLILLLIFS